MYVYMYKMSVPPWTATVWRRGQDNFDDGSGYILLIDRSDDSCMWTDEWLL